MTTPVIIDAIAVAVLAGFAIVGVWKGLLRTLAGLLVLVLALAGAGIVASALSVPAAKFVAPVIEKRLESRLDEAMEERFSKEERGTGGKQLRSPGGADVRRGSAGAAGH